MIRSIFIVLLCVVLVACSGATPSPSDGPYWPTQDWRSSSPEEQGIDGKALEDLLASIRQEGPDLDSLLVIRHGYIVSEMYEHGYTKDALHQVYSCTKSVIATLVGIAIDRGMIEDTSSPTLSFFPEAEVENLDANKRLMTLEHLLNMTTGLDWQESGANFSALYRSDDWVSDILGLPMLEPPGSSFNYCSGCTHLLSGAIQSASGEKTQKFAEQALFEPLGITRYNWETDSDGIPIGGWGLELTPRDMAKLGYLYLHAGEWEGEQVVSSTWIERATQKLVETDEELGYGYLWWTYPRFGAYAALGRDGQTIFVVPDQDLIIVTTASTQENHDAIFDMIEKDILPAIQAP